MKASSSRPPRGASEAASDESKRLSGKSEASEDGDWELVSRLNLSSLQEHRIARSQEDPCGAGQAARAMAAVNSAGDWLQWGLEGAVRGVERTYDGLTGLVHYKRLTKERKEALELASRQHWQLMELEQQRIQDRERIQMEGEMRLKEMADELAKVKTIKHETAEAVTRLRETEQALQLAGSETTAMAAEVLRLRREAAERKRHEADAVSALEVLEMRQNKLKSEEAARSSELEEREARLREMHSRQEAEMSVLKRQLQRLEREARDRMQGEEGSVDEAEGHEGAPHAGGREASQGERAAVHEGEHDDDDMTTRRISFGLDLPDEFYCSITMEVMTDPVIAADGFSYEREAIKDWLAKGRKTSPKTGANLASDMLLPNLSLKSLIQDRIQLGGRQI